MWMGSPPRWSPVWSPTPDERERIWQAMYDIWPAYNAYRGRAGREIKLFALTPAG